MDGDATEELTAHVLASVAAGTPLEVRGSGSKRFYGRGVRGEILSTQRHRGIIDYDPQELVLTARGGTLLVDIESALRARGQHLPFEPPHFGEGATLGGAIACGLAGPARPAAGPVRDFVLGLKVLTGDGHVLQFGGRVMKNVAGYDVARLMVGALGTLGVLLEISVKVLPRPPQEVTLAFPLDAHKALARMSDWAAKPLPITATCWTDDVLYARLHGSAAAVADGQRQIGGAELAEGGRFWLSIREHTHPFFRSDASLWRLSVPAEEPLEALRGRALIEWGGTQRWFVADDARVDVRSACAQARGFATRFRGRRPDDEVFAPLPEARLRVHHELKKAFDPHGILNPGRLYAAL
jgi:glycolate oxidase FAD binding subunit